MQLLRIGFFVMLMLSLVLSTRRWRSGKGTPLTWRDQEFRVWISRAKNKTLRRVTLSIEMEDKLRFLLRRENAFDRFAKHVGIASEWQTGDSGFDESVFIVSEDSALQSALAANRELRATCTKLMALHDGGEIECKQGRIYVDFRASAYQDQSDTGVAEKFATEAGALLISLRSQLQRIATGDWQSARDPSLNRKAWLVGISVALGLAGIVGMLGGIADSWHQVVRETIPRYATWTTVWVIGALLTAVFLWLRATPHTHAVLFDILLAALPGCWLTANAALTVYNEKFDRNTAQIVPVQVESTYYRSGKSRSFYLIVARWPDDRGNRTLQISEADYHWIKPGSCVMATWHRGQLGDGWVSGIQGNCATGGNAER